MTVNELQFELGNISAMLSMELNQNAQHAVGRLLQRLEHEEILGAEPHKMKLSTSIVLFIAICLALYGVVNFVRLYCIPGLRGGQP